MISTDIRKLVAYGIQTGLVPEEDVIFTTNRLLELFGLDELDPEEEKAAEEESAAAESETAEAAGKVFEIAGKKVTMSVEELESVLNRMLDYAYAHGLMEADSVVYRDLFDTKIMGCLMPRPSEVISKFDSLYAEEGPQAATDYYYKLSCDSNYIRR